MKKIIALLLIVVMAISLAACGGNTDGPTSTKDPTGTKSPIGTATPSGTQGDNPNPGTNPSTPGEKTNTSDLSTVEGYLEKYGYTVDDFQFTKDFSRVAYTSRKILRDNTYEVTEAGVFQTARKSNEEKQAWLEAFVNLAKTKSDDGKVYAYDIVKGISSEEYVAAYDPDAFTFLTRMAYKMGGKTLTVVLSYHNGLDNADPDEADYLVGIELEFEKTY